MPAKARTLLKACWMSSETSKVELDPSTGGMRYDQRAGTGRWSVLAAMTAGAAAATSGAATGAPQVENTEAVTYLITTTSTAANAFETDHSYARMEASLAQLTFMQAGTDLAVRSLAEQVADLRTRLDPIVTAGFMGEPSDNSVNLAELEAALMRAEASHDSEGVGDLLDSAADLELQSELLLNSALKWLNEDDPFSRAAAARVVAINDSETALRLLPPLVDAEDNLTAKSILRAALRSLGA